ncbi:MAG: tetratricopeptide repeat protein [Pseudomonadota bacterium]
MKFEKMAIILFAGIAVSAAGRSHAAMDMNQILSEISTIESEVAALEQTYLKEKDAVAATHIEKRVTDGELYFRLGDYQRSAIIFLDIVDRYQGHPAFPNALYMLAESMFHASDYYGARTRYIEILDHQGSSGFSQYITPALSRLLEISMHLQQFEGAEKYFSQLDSLSGGAVESITKYVKGKYFYFKDEFDRALQTFQGIKETEDYYYQSRFFMGVVYTRKQDFQSAIGIFEALSKMSAQSPKERKVLDLSRLNLGRLYYETNQLERSAEGYESIPPTSDLYDTALYEIAMVYIKMGDPTKAERSLEVLSISNPGSKLIPDAKILRGNLLLRSGRYDDAIALFKEIGKQFQPVKDQLDEIISEHPDPEEYFDEMVKANLGTFDAGSFLPSLAMAWMKQNPLTERGMQLLSEITLCEDVLEDNEKLIDKMKFVLEGKGKVNAFPMLKSGKARATQIENRLTQLLKAMLAYTESLAPGTSSAKLGAIRNEMEDLDKVIDGLPTSPEEFAEREKKAKANYSKLGQALAISEAKVDRLHAKIVATKLYIEGAIMEKTGVIPADVKAVLTELDAQEAAVEGYRGQIKTIVKMIQLAKSSVGIGDESDERDTSVRAVYIKQMKETVSLLGSAGVDSGTMSKLDGMIDRMDGVRKKINSFNAIVETMAMKKSQEILATIEKETLELEAQEEELEKLSGESGEVVGFLTLADFTEVKKSFDDLIVKADVGVIDVAWGRKEEHRNRVQYLTSERLEQLQFLDDEFKEIFEAEKDEEKTEEEEGE